MGEKEKFCPFSARHAECGDWCPLYRSDPAGDDCAICRVAAALQRLAYNSANYR